MVFGGIVELVLRIPAEGKSLEEIARPVTMGGQTGGATLTTEPATQVQQHEQRERVYNTLCAWAGKDVCDGRVDRALKLGYVWKADSEPGLQRVAAAGHG